MISKTRVLEVQFEADHAYRLGDTAEGNPYPGGSHERLVWAEQFSYREQQEQGNEH